MVPAGNKAKHVSSVNHTTKTIHHHHHSEISVRRNIKAACIPFAKTLFIGNLCLIQCYAFVNWFQRQPLYQQD